MLTPIRLDNRDIDTYFDFFDESQHQYFDHFQWQTSSQNSDEGIIVKFSYDWISLSYSKSPSTALTFYIGRDGSKVVCVKPDTIPIGDAESFILGPILGCVLRLLKRVCLHASVMELGGKAFAFIGNKGAGKSTTAAALINSGAKLISDDVAVLNAKSIDDTTVQSGYPGIRLLPSTLRSFGLNQDNYQRVVSGNNKRYIALNESASLPLIDSKQNATKHWKFYSGKPCSLSMIYVLNQRQNDSIRTKITVLNHKAALMALAPHGYGRRVLGLHERADEFKYMAELSQRIQVKSAHFPNKLALLTQVAEDILEDASNSH